MKSVVATLGLAAIANAYSFPKHVHYQRGNYTEPGATTLTVYTTQVHTVTSCAPTVTNCPARQTDIDALPEKDKAVVVVTDTVVLTETVCPVSEAGKISSSIVQQAQTGGITPQYTVTAPITTAPAAPLSTGYSSPVTDSDNSGEENSSYTTLTSSYVTAKTLTLTIGTGYDAEVTTTVVTSTIETTVTVPCSQTTEAGNSGVTPTKGSDNGNSYGQGSSEELTTTTTGTKTATITLTISEADTTETKVSGGDNSGEDNGSATDYSTPEATGGNSSSEDTGSEGSCECNGATATVTVTAPASTVYVTVGTEASKTATYGSESTGTGSSGDDDEDDDEDDEDYCDDDTTTTLQATVTVVPYPVNSTIPGGYAKPTGFARLVR